MDIYSVLSSKEHNSHYLNRYITFINKCQLKNKSYTGYTERHHICPKAKDMFPEYNSFDLFPWNCAVLTLRQHFIAHMMLWKIYSNCSQTFAFWAMKQKNNETLNSKIYEKLKLDIIDKITKINSGKVWINDGNKSTIIPKEKLDQYILEKGWYLGRVFSKEHKNNISNNAKERYKDPTKNPRYNAIVTEETRKKISEKNTGRKMSHETKEKISKSKIGIKKSDITKLKMKRTKGSEIFITDGISNKRIKSNIEIPSGWKRGITRLPKL